MNACNVVWRELEPNIRHFSAFIRCSKASLSSDDLAAHQSLICHSLVSHSWDNSAALICHLQLTPWSRLALSLYLCCLSCSSCFWSTTGSFSLSLSTPSLKPSLLLGWFRDVGRLTICRTYSKNYKRKQRSSVRVERVPKTTIAPLKSDMWAIGWCWNIPHTVYSIYSGAQVMDYHNHQNLVYKHSTRLRGACSGLPQLICRHISYYQEVPLD